MGGWVNGLQWRRPPHTRPWPPWWMGDELVVKKKSEKKNWGGRKEGRKGGHYGNGQMCSAHRITPVLRPVLSMSLFCNVHSRSDKILDESFLYCTSRTFSYCHLGCLTHPRGTVFTEVTPLNILLFQLLHIGNLYFKIGLAWFLKKY